MQYALGKGNLVFIAWHKYFISCLLKQLIVSYHKVRSK